MASGTIGSQKSYSQFPQPIVAGPPLTSYPNAGTYINNAANAAFVANWLAQLGIPNPNYNAILIGLDGEIWATRSPVPASGLPSNPFGTWFTKIYDPLVTTFTGGNMPGVLP